MVAAAPGDNARAAGRDQQRDEQEREQRQQHESRYTSILMTWRIQMKPIVCMTIAPISIIWPMRSREQQLHVLGVDERQRDAERRRQRQQHVAGEAAVRRVHAHLPLDLEALAHDVREVVENLRQVAAGLALDQHRGDEEPHVEQRRCARPAR